MFHTLEMSSFCEALPKPKAEVHLQLDNIKLAVTLWVNISVGLLVISQSSAYSGYLYLKNALESYQKRNNNILSPSENPLVSWGKKIHDDCYSQHILLLIINFNANPNNLLIIYNWLFIDICDICLQPQKSITF